MVYLKNFRKWKKIRLIPPLNVGNKLETDFKEKARLFNEFFASKCTPITNDSSLPSLLNLSLTCNLFVINFTDDDILKNIRSLNIDKAHGHDDISVRMVKICVKAILEPLSRTVLAQEYTQIHGKNLTLFQGTRKGINSF